MTPAEYIQITHDLTAIVILLSALVILGVCNLIYSVLR